MTPKGAAAIASMKHGVTVDDIFGHCRRPRFVRARRDAWQLLRDAGWSLAEIADAFKRNHTTIWNGTRPPR